MLVSLYVKLCLDSKSLKNSAPCLSTMLLLGRRCCCRVLRCFTAAATALPWCSVCCSHHWSNCCYCFTGVLPCHILLPLLLLLLPGAAMPLPPSRLYRCFSLFIAVFLSHGLVAHTHPYTLVAPVSTCSYLVFIHNIFYFHWSLLTQQRPHNFSFPPFSPPCCEREVDN